MPASGQLALSGTLRPFDPEPSLRLHRTSFTDLDLGRLLNKPGLTTRLAGTLEAQGEGRSPKHARMAGRSSSILPPSTISPWMEDESRQRWTTASSRSSAG